jgi:hypothetical protein
METYERPVQQGREAVRLTFRYEGERVELVGRQRLEKRARASDPILDRGERARLEGSWLELRDGEGRTLYRRVLHEPIAFSVEVPGDEADGSLARRTVEDPRGTFFVIVPELKGAREVVLFASPPPKRGRERGEGDRREARAAREIGRFDLLKAGDGDRPRDVARDADEEGAR